MAKGEIVNVVVVDVSVSIVAIVKPIATKTIVRTEQNRTYSLLHPNILYTIWGIVS